jgi:hypothetical protein
MKTSDLSFVRRCSSGFGQPTATTCRHQDDGGKDKAQTKSSHEDGNTPVGFIRTYKLIIVGAGRINGAHRENKKGTKSTF